MSKPAKIYPEKVADQLATKLEQLAQHPKGLQVRDLVFRLRPKIEAAQQSGYSLEEIAEAFKEEGVNLTLNTLKRYLQESRASSQTTKEQHSPKKTRSQKVESPKPETKTEKTEQKPQLTNTNEDGFQEMRSNDDL